MPSSDINRAPNERSAADFAYSRLRSKILTFELLPAQHLNEVGLARELDVSRTPLREAINRLIAERMLLPANRGFVVPNLDPNLVWQLFEARSEIEQSIVRLVADRAAVEELKQLHVFVDESAAASPDVSVDELLTLDRRFHEGMAALTRNVELVHILKNINDRIQLVRWIAMEGKRQTTQGEHRAIVQALLARDGEKAARLVGAHIMHRSDEIFAAVKRAYAHAHTMQYDTSRPQDAAAVR